MELCRQVLLTIKGVISITFDFALRRVILRTKRELSPEVNY